MPLVKYTHKKSEIPADAKNIVACHGGAGFDNFKDKDKPFHGPRVYWTYETHHGLCLMEWEQNGYDDSDFFMRLWNPEKGEPETVMFATTRGWSYPCLASRVDATPETVKAYNEWQEKARLKRLAEERARKADELRKFRSSTLKAVRGLQNAPHHKLMGLRRHLRMDDAERVVKLVANTRLRSSFKKKLQKQAIEWLANDKPKYKTPLSAKQMRYI